MIRWREASFDEFNCKLIAGFRDQQSNVDGHSTQFFKLLAEARKQAFWWPDIGPLKNGLLVGVKRIDCRYGCMMVA
jgi:hypothetical protein